MKPHLFKVLDKWLAFYRGDQAPTGFTAADTAVEAYRLLVAGNLTVEYQPSAADKQQTAEVYYLHAVEPVRRPHRSRHRAVKATCRASSGRAAAALVRLPVYRSN
jgi:hypothetical protein